MKTSHTPGPWRVNIEFKHKRDDYNEIIALDGFHYTKPGFSITGCIGIHDAKLIAAAPDLLEALRQAKEVIDRLCSDVSAMTGQHANYSQGELSIIESAIKRATE